MASGASSTEGNQDELTMRQQRSIEQEISSRSPLIGRLEEVSCLVGEYSGDPVYSAKAMDLAAKYTSLRRTRPDGNCFFRAIAFAHLERLCAEPRPRFDAFQDTIRKSKQRLVDLGFTQFTVEDFFDTTMEVVQRLADRLDAGDADAARNELHLAFNDQSYSDYVVVYLRLITSAQLRTHKDFYQNFIEGDHTVEEFCHQEVEPMYKESDHIHIIALCTALEAGVRVRYMDRGEGAEVIAHDFPEGTAPSVHLLYRPGHYDILYP